MKGLVAMFDCVFVGVTFPGLLLGAMLANAGKKVLLLDRKKVAGGKISSWEREGFLSLQGIPRVRNGEKGAFFKICKQIGLDLSLIPMNQAWILDTDEKLKRITVGKPGFLLLLGPSTLQRSSSSEAAVMAKR